MTDRIMKKNAVRFSPVDFLPIDTTDGMATKIRGWSPKTDFLLHHPFPPSQSQRNEVKDSLSFKTNTNNLNDNSKITHHGGYDIIDHAFGPRFPSQLLKELQSNGWIDDPAHGIKGRLNPARTKTDVDMAKLLNGFVNPFLENNGNDSVGSSDVSSNSSVGPIGVRGDESAFISRKDRSDFAFPDKNPCLHHLVSSIESTAFRRLGKPHAAIDHTAKGATKIEENNNGNTATTAKKSETSIHFEFDKTLTSVQIAKYPCDGQAGYPRHCDRGNACLKEPIANHLPLDKQEKGAERILTFIYYLTPSEWDGDLDGGALRIFSPCQNDVIAASMQNDDECGCDGCRDGSNKQTASSVDANYFDVVPYSDRMVAFRSDVIEHQVMPSLRRERIAITVWLYGRAVQAGANSAKLIPNYFCLKGDTKVENTGRATNSTDESGIEEVPDTAKKLSNNVSSYPPPLPLPKDKNQNKTIFVAIPSYRDEETWPTIKSLIQTACYPERIYIGVVWQIDTLSQDEMQYFMNGKNMIESLENLFSLGSVWRYNKNVRSITLDYRQATGPCYARHLAQTLHRDEDYILQIDSHMRFRSNWDEYLICQLKKCPAVPSLSADSVVEMSEDSPRPRAVLTTYPPGYELPNGPGVNAETRGTVLVPWKFGQDGMLRQKGRLLRPGYRHNERSDSSAHSRNDNIPCLLYAGGFNFFHSSLLDECPYDHKLHGLFFGEEISMAVRLFTHGYELFAPPETVCYHLWSSRSRNRNDNDGSQRPKLALGRESSLEVVRMQLRGKGRGLGKVRSAEQFSRELGVDTEKHTLSQGCENIRLHCNTFVSPITAELDSGCTPDLLDAARPALKEECTNNDMTTVLKLVSQFMGHT